MQIYAATFRLLTDIHTHIFHYQMSLWKIYLLPAICIGRQYTRLIDTYIFPVVVYLLCHSSSVARSLRRVAGPPESTSGQRDDEERKRLPFVLDLDVLLDRKSNTTSIYIAIDGRKRQTRKSVKTVYRWMIRTGQSASLPFRTRVQSVFEWSLPSPRLYSSSSAEFGKVEESFEFRLLQKNEVKSKKLSAPHTCGRVPGKSLLSADPLSLLGGNTLICLDLEMAKSSARETKTANSDKLRSDSRISSGEDGRRRREIAERIFHSAAEFLLHPRFIFLCRSYYFNGIVSDMVCSAEQAIDLRERIARAMFGCVGGGGRRPLRRVFAEQIAAHSVWRCAEVRAPPIPLWIKSRS